MISKQEGTEFCDECQPDILPDELLEQNHHPCWIPKAGTFDEFKGKTEVAQST